MRLYSFWRSSAAFRVRIALNLKRLPFETLSTSLGKGVHRAPEYTALNPQGLIPTLVVGGTVLAQSLAIIEYLDETHPEPAFLPSGAAARAAVRSMAQAIACDIHPLNNLRVLNYLKGALGHDESVVKTWYRHWIAEGFTGLEELARRHSADRRFLFGAAVSMADICLVPQVYNARRFECDLAPFPTLTAIAAALEALPAFADARPEVQPDAT
jgi:maleylacetoacetate isomerase